MTIPSTGSSSDTEAVKKILEDFRKLEYKHKKKPQSKEVEPYSLASRMDFAPGIIEKFPPTVSDSEAIKEILEEHSKIEYKHKKKPQSKEVEPYSLASRMDFAPGVIIQKPTTEKKPPSDATSIPTGGIENITPRTPRKSRREQWEEYSCRQIE